MTGAVGGARTKCQAVLRTPPLIVVMRVPSALTFAVPTCRKVPVSGDSDQRSSSLPGVMVSWLGNVIGTGVAITTPAG
jgi:hypothetical protein